jgi:hypothetical protein
MSAEERFMERNGRVPLLVGVGALLCAFSLYEFVLPRIFRAPSPARVASASEHDAPEPVEPALEARVPFDGSSGSAELVEDSERETPLQRLAELLTRDAGFQTIDLSSWRMVDQYAQSTGSAFHTVVGLTSADAPALVARLKGARSLRMQQMLLLTLGKIGPTEDLEWLGARLDVPALRATCAYALGRLGTPAAVDALNARLHRKGVRGDEREVLYFGLAQIGAIQVPELLDAVLRGVNVARPPAADSMLACVGDPNALPMLRDIVDRRSEPLVRAMAVGAAVRIARNEPSAFTVDDRRWLEELARERGTPTDLRARAWAGLVELDETRCRELLGSALNEPNLDPELLHGLLDVASLCSVPAESFARVLELVRDDSDADASALAVRALVRADDPEVDARLAQLFRDTPSRTRLDAMFGLLERAGRAADLGAAEGRIASSPLLAAIRELVDDPSANARERGLGLEILGRSEEYAAWVSDSCWARYLAGGTDENAQRIELMSRAALIGDRATNELLREFDGTEQVVSRIQILDALASTRDEHEDPKMVHFMRSRAIPYLRDALEDRTGALIAGIGPRAGERNELAITLSNAFGRFGERTDIAWLDTLASRFDSQQDGWPDELRVPMRETIAEAAARASDLISLRLDS